MDQENEMEESGQGKEPQNLNGIHKKLLFGVLFITIVAIGAYVTQFWGWPLSTKPSDWAHFATYLSGTVGVAAVVATLRALLKTLEQQQAMILSQEKQIKKTEDQIVSEKKYREIERAYQMTMNILPHLIKDVGRSFKEQELEYYDSPSKSLRKVFSVNDIYGYAARVNSVRGIVFFESYGVRDFKLKLEKVLHSRVNKFVYIVARPSMVYADSRFEVIKKGKSKYAVNELIAYKELYNIDLPDLTGSCFKVFKKVAKAANFSSDNIKKNEDIKDYVDLCFEEVFVFCSKINDSGETKVSYLSMLLCYHSLLLGFGAKVMYEDNINLLKLPSVMSLVVDFRVSNAPDRFEHVLNNWYEIGVLLRKLSRQV